MPEQETIVDEIAKQKMMGAITEEQNMFNPITNMLQSAIGLYGVRKVLSDLAQKVAGNVVDSVRNPGRALENFGKTLPDPRDREGVAEWAIDNANTGVVGSMVPTYKFIPKTKGMGVKNIDEFGTIKPMTPKERAGDIPTGKPESKPEGGNKEPWQMKPDEFIAKESAIPAPPTLQPDERLWLRYGQVPDSGKSKHLQHGYEEAGVSVMAPLDELGKTTWSPNMLFSATAGDLDKKNLYVVSGKKIGRGSDGEPIIEGARIIRRAHPLERHQLVKDMEDVAVNRFGFRKIDNLFSRLDSEIPDYHRQHEDIVKKAVFEGKPVPREVLDEYGLKSSDPSRSPQGGK